MKEKFITLQVLEGPFGGYYLNIVSYTPKMARKFQVWLVWIYDISGDNTEFQIRNIEEFLVKKKDEGDYLQLLEQGNLKYWI